MLSSESSRYRGKPIGETLLQIWKAISEAASSSSGIAEALARGAAELAGDVGGILHRLPSGTWQAVVHGPAPAGISRRAVDAPPPPASAPEDDRAAWLGVADLAGAAVVALTVDGKPWGRLAVGRLGKEDAFVAEDRELLGRLAEVSSPALAMALAHERLSGATRGTEGLDRWRHAFIEDCPSTIFLKDANGHYVFVNQGYERLCGVPREQVLKMVDEEIFPAEQAAFFRTIDKQILSTGKPVITTDKFFIGGEWRVFLACKYPVRDAEGKVVGVGGHVTPIPDEKISNEALARGEEQLNFITDALPELMAYLDVNERFRFVNRAYEKWFGLDRRDIIGKSLEEIFGPETYELMRPHVQQALAFERPRFDLRLTHYDGVIRDTRVTLAPQGSITRKVEGVVVLITDMTEQKLAEERLRFLGDVGGLLASRLDDTAETWAPLKTIAALSVLKLADWCVVELRRADGALEQLAAAHVDLEKTALLKSIHAWLAHEEGLLNLPRVMASGRAELCAEITEEQLAQAVRDPEMLKRVQDVGLRTAIVVPITTRSGTIGVIVLAGGSARRRYDESDLTQAVELARRAALATDNTELFTQKTRAVELRDNFLATASHELRTPLTSLGLHLDALMMEAKVLSKKEPGLSRFQESLNRAMFHSERLGGLIRQLLDVSRLREGNTLDIAREMVDLNNLVREVADRFTDEAARASCALEVTLPGQAVIGYWDPLRLDQVVTNLIGNAIKYGAGKPVQVEVSAGKDRARLVVRDHGIGIPPGDIDRIFGKFERAVPERHYGGLGLGLWITRQALEAMGGTIQVASTQNVETAFTVELPLGRS